MASSESHIDLLCDRFEDAWRIGLRPRIEDYLDQTTGPMRSALFHALLPVELELRRDAGEDPRPGDY